MHTSDTTQQIVIIRAVDLPHDFLGTRVQSLSTLPSFTWRNTRKAPKAHLWAWLRRWMGDAEDHRELSSSLWAWHTGGTVADPQMEAALRILDRVPANYKVLVFYLPCDRKLGDFLFCICSFCVSLCLYFLIYSIACTPVALCNLGILYEPRICCMMILDLWR